MAPLRSDDPVLEPPLARKGMARAGADDEARGRDDLELAAKVATIALSSPLVRRLNSEVLRYVIRAAKERHFASGELIAGAGEREVGLLVILRGHIGVEARTAAGTSKTLTTLGPGEICAGEPLVAGIPALPALRAQTPVEALAVPYGVARILVAREPAIAELVSHHHLFLSRSAVIQMASALRLAEDSELLERTRFVTIEPRECILAEGVVSDSVYLLATGGVEIAVPHPIAGFEDVPREAPGTLLGHLSALGSAERAATWTTAETCMLHIPRRFLELEIRAGRAEVRIPPPLASAARSAA